MIPRISRDWLPLALYLALVLAGGAVCVRHLTGCAANLSGPAGRKPADTEALQAKAKIDLLYRGFDIFQRNCAVCHGEKGRGNGAAAESVFPRPRDFASGQFRLTTTTRGLPSDQDLSRTIRNGMFPSLMPPWPDFSDESLQALALAIRYFAVQGRAGDLMAEDPDLPRAKAFAIAREIMESGPPVQLPAQPAQVDLSRGRAFFESRCAVCHDLDGRAQKRLDLRDSMNQPTRPRNLTTGPYKGGFELKSIATRIVRGIPGSPMPSFREISPEDLWSTAAYVQSLKVADPPPMGACPTKK